MTSIFPKSVNDFKDTKGSWRTISLFHENYTHSALKFSPIYTLKDYDVTLDSGEVLPSIQRLYLELNDPTEWLVATTLFGGWRHWETLCSQTWFKDIVESLRYQLDVKIKSEAIQNLLKETSNPSSLKFLATGDYKNPGKGRPSKKELEHQKLKEASIKANLVEDAERLGIPTLSIVKDSNAQVSLN